jgi:hypothetical protein
VIYRDLADNGRLDGKYTRAEIERALNLRQLLGTDKRQPARSRRAADVPRPAVPPRAARKDARRVPFSGLDVALLIAGGGPLLLIGAGLRRRLATARVEPTVARG